MNIPIVLALVSLLFMGLAAFFNKVAASDGIYFPPFLMIVNVAYIVMAAVIHVTQKQAFAITARTFWIGMLVGLFGSIGYACMFYALKKGGEGSVVFPIVGLGVLVSITLSVIVYREPITAARLLGFGLAAGSIVLLAR
ncbi:MAG TPA: EamA family transporter [Anaerolineales bacterium]|jgi:uncharacterized membrane protein|nr:EamA family transporter [Anaerolineales bacterium]